MLRRCVPCFACASTADLSFLEVLGVKNGLNPGCFDGKEWKASGPIVPVISPIDGKQLGNVSVQLGTEEDCKRCIANVKAAQRDWQLTPAPIRGQIVREIGEELRGVLKPLGRALSLEVGKIESEGIGEVQEYVDICDFATGLSRQLPGQVIPSERPGHFMMEQWHPLGTLGIIAAFNFPIAVAGWNTAISMIAGNTQIWKGSETTNLCGIATTNIVNRVLARHGVQQIAAFCAGGVNVGKQIVSSTDVEIVSFTGSCAVGRQVNMEVAGRFGKSILELGGNNALIVLDDADLSMAMHAVLFGAVGTCGQRCTTLRRLCLHEKIYDAFLPKLVELYKKLKIGDPTVQGNLVGPLHNQIALDKYKHAVKTATAQGGKLVIGGKNLPVNEAAGIPGPWYVEPTIIECPSDLPMAQEETFAPILYVHKIKDLDEGIRINNQVEQGLSAALFTGSVRNSYKWTSAVGAYNGIVNVNVPTNGAEIGGAFGGEKSTGGGRESGSDAWKQYMRRVTSTVNYSDKLPLAQGVSFDV